jgi:hypothetical protein
MGSGDKDGEEEEDDDDDGVLVDSPRLKNSERTRRTENGGLDRINDDREKEDDINSIDNNFDVTLSSESTMAEIKNENMISGNDFVDGHLLVRIFRSKKKGAECRICSLFVEKGEDIAYTSRPGSTTRLKFLHDHA